VEHRAAHQEPTMSEHEVATPPRAEQPQGMTDARARPAPPSKRRRSFGDLIPTLLDDYAWDPDQAEASLDALFDHAREDAKEAINWYLRKKRSKKLVATRSAAWWL